MFVIATPVDRYCSGCVLFENSRSNSLPRFICRLSIRVLSVRFVSYRATGGRSCTRRRLPCLEGSFPSRVVNGFVDYHSVRVGQRSNPRGERALNSGDGGSSWSTTLDAVVGGWRWKGALSIAYYFLEQSDLAGVCWSKDRMRAGSASAHVARVHLELALSVALAQLSQWLHKAYQPPTVVGVALYAPIRRS